MKVTPFLLVLFLLSACTALPPQRALVARGGENNFVTLSPAPCEGNALLQGYRSGSLVYRGREYTACWRPQGTDVMVIDSAGDVSKIPIRAFEIEEVGQDR